MAQIALGITGLPYEMQPAQSCNLAFEMDEYMLFALQSFLDGIAIEKLQRTVQALIIRQRRDNRIDVLIVATAIWYLVL